MSGRSRSRAMTPFLIAWLVPLGLTPCLGCEVTSATAVLAPPGGRTLQSPVLTVQPKQATIPNPGGTLQLTATVTDQGNVMVGVVVAWVSLDSTVARVDPSGLVTGIAPGMARIVANHGQAADTAQVGVASPPPIGPAGYDALTAIIGPILPRGMGGTPETVRYDQRYMSTEPARWQDFLTGRVGIPAANHYGGLRSRLMWAIRNGEPIGPAAMSETYAYGRGRRIVREYLAYSKANDYGTQPHNNTGLADIEAYYVLEGDEDARNHLWRSAVGATKDPYGYLNCRNKNADARQPAVYIQALAAAHRLEFPHTNSPGSTSAPDLSRGSWLADGRWLIDYAMSGCVQADGSIPSPAHGGIEAFLFNAMLATILLQWHGWTEPAQPAYDAALLIMDHIIAVDAQSAARGWSTLPYTSNGSRPAEDLAAFYIWPALVLWQETADPKYRTFALRQMAAVNRTSSISGFKQWNQMYSTLGQGAEALLSGMRWR